MPNLLAVCSKFFIPSATAVATLEKSSFVASSFVLNTTIAVCSAANVGVDADAGIAGVGTDAGVERVGILKVGGTIDCMDMGKSRVIAAVAADESENKIGAEVAAREEPVNDA